MRVVFTMPSWICGTVETRAKSLTAIHSQWVWIFPMVMRVVFSVSLWICGIVDVGGLKSDDSHSWGFVISPTLMRAVFQMPVWICGAVKLWSCGIVELWKRVLGNLWHMSLIISVAVTSFVGLAGREINYQILTIHEKTRFCRWVIWNTSLNFNKRI